VIDRLVTTGIDASLACRVLRVSRSGYYAWKKRPPSYRSRTDADLTSTIVRIHSDSRAGYGARRVHAELRLGLQVRCESDSGAEYVGPGSSFGRSAQHS
jgi:hypothetical protein